MIDDKLSLVSWQIISIFELIPCRGISQIKKLNPIVLGNQRGFFFRLIPMIDEVCDGILWVTTGTNRSGWEGFNSVSAFYITILVA